MGTNNGESHSHGDHDHDHDHDHGPFELNDELTIATKDGSELLFKVIGTMEDPDEAKTYAVLVHDDEATGEQEFIVTDTDGNMLEDDALAQEILDEFLLFAEEAGEGEESTS